MQHMAVLRSFRIPWLATVPTTVPPPTLRTRPPQIIAWQGPSNLVYRVESRTDLAPSTWATLGTATSVSTNYSFTNQSILERRFFRAVYP